MLSPNLAASPPHAILRASQDEALLPARTPLTLPHHQPLGALKVRWCRKRNSSLQPGESADIDTGREAAAHITALRCSQRHACVHMKSMDMVGGPDGLKKYVVAEKYAIVPCCFTDPTE